MTYDQALEWLNSLTNYERAPAPDAMRAMRLERMQALCEGLGNPQTAFRSILVAGTNGKGSICAMLYAILKAAGMTVGLYTSPHLVDLCERIRVAGPRATAQDDWIRQDDLAQALTHLQERMRSLPAVFADNPPTYFEVLTAAAFWHFRQQGVRVAVLEVGLGGRLDATNVVQQDVSVIGPIGLDHQAILGASVSEIAAEKAAIIKHPHRVISACQVPEVAAVLRRRAAECDSSLIEVGRDLSIRIQRHAPDGLQCSIQTPRGEYTELQLSLLGRHQADNAALAIAAIEALADSGMPHGAIRRGVAQVRWPGRIERVCEEPTVIFDGAHNPQAAEALRCVLQELWPDSPMHLLIGVSSDKAIQAIGERLCPLATTVTCTRSRHPRACDPHLLASQLTPVSRHLSVIPEAGDAYTYLVNTIGPQEVLVVTGSLFLVGQLSAAQHRLVRLNTASGVDT